MATYSKVLLSGSTNGRPIKVSATSPGTLIHTAVSGSSDIDEIYLYACNTHTSAILLTITWGGILDPDDHIEFSIPGESGLYCISPGLPLQNSLIINAHAATADKITIVGFINRITA